MSWNNIKTCIENDLNSRNLKDPNIRLNALSNIENIMKRHFQEYLANPVEKFGTISKQDFIEKIEKHKETGKLNSAEKSIINEIYYRI